MDERKRAAGSWVGGRLCSCCHSRGARRAVSQQARARLKADDRRRFRCEAQDVGTVETER